MQIRVYLKEKLARFGILAYDVFKKHGNEWAIVTVAKEANGNHFIKHYQAREKLVYQGRQLRCKKSNKKAEALKIMSLLDKEEELKRKSQKPTLQTSKLSQPHFAFTAMSSGVWRYGEDGLYFEQRYQDPRRGTIIFGKTALVIYLESRKDAASRADWHCRVDIPYGIIEHTIPSNDRGQGFLMLTLKSPPKIYRIESDENLHLYTNTEKVPGLRMPDLGAMSLNASRPSERERPLQRLCMLQRHYHKSAALCMVYKIQFSNTKSMRFAWNFIKDFAAPGVNAWSTAVLQLIERPIESEYKVLEQALAIVTGSKISFDVSFQLMALVLEGTLSPVTAGQLIRGLCIIAGYHGSTKTAVGVRNLAHQIPTPAPNLDGDRYYSISSIVDKIEANITESQTDVDNLSKATKHEHLALTHKATITPTGMLLRGPEWGVSNRVLRRYSKHTKRFMRVFFTDEDGLSVFHDPRSSQEEVYERFRNVLRDGITIAGRTFEFLGFSHASLRYHAVWFMAPFEENGVQVRAKDVIYGLGDFEHIHCSAKCAARIGQAFSDTVHSVRVPDDADVLETKDDVTRNGRTFSDGCGTISKALLQRVWRSLPPNRRSKRPTVLQIRYRGAKGVVSLDNALLGEQLHIRKSMTKYVAREGWRDLELCGAAYTPLKMFLNHQFIKILEDLNVPMRSLFAVQDDALKELELLVQHPLNAAWFLGTCTSRHIKYHKLTSNRTRPCRQICQDSNFDPASVLHRDVIQGRSISD